MWMGRVPSIWIRNCPGMCMEEQMEKGNSAACRLQIMIRCIAAVVLAFIALPCVRAAAAEPGLAEEDGSLHYYNDQGELVTNQCVLKIKSGGKEGYYRIDADGNVEQWEKEKARAAERLLKLRAVPADPDNTKEVTKCLKKAFQWSAKLKYVNVTKKVKKDAKALAYYGDYGFVRAKGDCNVQAATFTLMAQVLGFDARFVRGLVPQALKNGKPANFGSHAWCTIKEGKKTYVFDPNFERTHKAGWKFKYGAKKHYRYFTKKKKEIK